jgi:multidrug efflux pump subunit AcrA (membrane-fusion protein)
MKKRKRWLIGIALVVVLAAAAGGYYYYRTQIASAQAAAEEEPDMQTAVARRGDLVVSASGTGSVVPASEIGLGFEEAGTLLELNVKVGDEVKAGDVLARLQTKNSEEEIAAAVSDAELSVIQSQQSLDELYANAEIARTTAMSDIATYSQAVRDAQYQLENYNMPAVLQGMDAITAVDTMKVQLDAASAAFEPYRFFAENNQVREKLLEDLNLAQSNYDAAVKRLNYEYELQVAEANLAKARQEYEDYKDGPAADELALAQATLANAQDKLVLAKQDQSVLELVAPMDGTVMDITADVGASLGTETLVTLADLKQTLLQVYLDESDLDLVKAGYAAEATFDALPDQTFTGKVTVVSPGLEEVSNVQAIKVLVALDPGSVSAPLPVGLTASVDVIAGKAENAVLVPIEALRDLGDGEYAVFVVVDGQPELRVVQVGLQDITYAEIISGVEEGDIVSTGIVQTK